jgi:hypothetical protein
MHVALVLHVVRKAGEEVVLAVPQCVPIIPGASGIQHYLLTLFVSLVSRAPGLYSPEEHVEGCSQK